MFLWTFPGQFCNSQPIEQLFFALKPGCNGGEQQRFAEAAGTAQKVVLAAVNELPDQRGLVHIHIAAANNFTKILNVHYATDPWQNALAGALGVNPFFVKDYPAAARNFPIAECVRCISVLREFDLKAIGYNKGETSEKDLYREMVFKLLHQS